MTTMTTSGSDTCARCGHYRSWHTGFLCHGMNCMCGEFKGAIDAPGTTTGIDHPDTSHDAAARVKPRSGTQRRRVMDAIRDSHMRGLPGLTDEQVATITGLSLNSVRPRRQELQKAGWVEATDYRQETSSGGMAIVWRYKP